MPAPRVPCLLALAPLLAVGGLRVPADDEDDEGAQMVEQMHKSDTVSSLLVTDDCHVWTGGYNGEIVEWGCEVLPDLPYKTVKEFRRFNHSDASPVPVRALARIGSVIFSGGADGRVAAFNLQDSTRVATVNVGTMVQTLTTDDRYLYIGGYDGIVNSFDTYTDKLDRCRRYGTGTVNALGYPKNGDLIYVGGTDGAIDVWYLDSNEWTAIPCGAGESCRCPIVTETQAANASQVVMDDLMAGNLGATAANATRAAGPVVTTFASAGTGRTLYSASVDGVIRAWDTGTGENVGYMTLPNMNKINCLAMTSNGHTIYSGGDNVAFQWKVNTYVVDNRTSGYWIGGVHGPMYSFGDEIHAIALDEQKGRLYLAGKGGEAMAFDAQNGTWLYRMWHKKIDWNEEDPLAAMGGSRGGFTLGAMLQANATVKNVTEEPYEAMAVAAPLKIPKKRTAATSPAVVTAAAEKQPAVAAVLPSGGIADLRRH